jgi:hypothetical protein
VKSWWLTRVVQFCVVVHEVAFHSFSYDNSINRRQKKVNFGDRLHPMKVIATLPRHEHVTSIGRADSSLVIVECVSYFRL